MSPCNPPFQNIADDTGVVQVIQGRVGDPGRCRR